MSFLFYDYETFGKNAAKDRPAQFAAIRTDEHFTPIEDPINYYCQPESDYLPDPEACLITGITPQLARRKGLKSADFANHIFTVLNQPNTISLGYNSIRFDDEVNRYLFYRNLRDPYQHSWANGNARWDLLDVVRTFYALKPDALHWPVNEDGALSIKLELLSQANQFEHEKAHDALSDVYATIALAKALQQADPSLFETCLSLRNKQQAIQLINPNLGQKPILHISGMFRAQNAFASYVLPITWHPQNKNALIALDLTQPCDALLQHDDVEQLRTWLYTPRDQLNEQQLVPIKQIHVNKAPMIFPAATLSAQRADEIGIDRKRCRQNLDALRQRSGLAQLVADIVMPSTEFDANKDVDEQLYDGFFSQTDKIKLQQLQKLPPEELAHHGFIFEDPRIATLIFRYRARNYPQYLSSTEWQQWQQHCIEKLNPQLADYFSRLEQLLQEHADSAHKVAILQALQRYPNEL